MLYPLLTERRFVQPIWGGAALAAWLDLPEPRPERLGEVWQVYDTNPVANGPLAGRTLADVTRQYGADLVGTRTVERYGVDFPLLAKFIAAAQPLSIQVHPDDAYAHSREAATGFHGKTEAWYILRAEPGASVVYGLKHDSSREEFAAAIAAGQVEDLLARVPVAAGDVIFVPAGTVHAIDAGVVLFEIQQKSDLTYRVYDYGRLDAASGKPRELHLAKALDVIDYRASDIQGAPASAAADGDDRTRLLVRCPWFALERRTLAAAESLNTDPGTFEILTAIGGAGAVRWPGGSLRFGHGESLVLPAALGAYELAPSNQEPLILLRAYVPAE